MKKTYQSPLLEIIEAKGIEAVMETLSYIGEIGGGDVLSNKANFEEEEEEEEDEDKNNDLWANLGNVALWD